MLSASRKLKDISLIRRNLRQLKNYGLQYSQRCDVNECDCPIPQPKCKRRPEVVLEVNCDRCMFECWEYKPRPRFAPAKTQDEMRQPPRNCEPGMKDPKWRNPTEEKEKADKCQYMSRVDAPISPCPKVFKGKLPKPCLEDPFKFEDEKLPAPDWDFTKKPFCQYR
ncbi:hypothetical protein HHI36_008768 [Cryptolaemus montrouzieri]|uniref:Uncharacterized protein n=1 Tax=Cryptolaemus montrouzieri TaxID=559131 RepID=A0ABD2MTJ2_9CUCU